MKIKLNNKKYEIKTAENLTVSEYIEFFDNYEPEMSALRSVILYLSVITGLKFADIAMININEKTLFRISIFVGQVMSIEEIIENQSTIFVYGHTGETLFQKKQDWQTVGVRMLLQERNSENVIELCTYLLAILIEKAKDKDIVEETYEKLLDYNAINVLSFSSFFFQKLKIGTSSEIISIRKIMMFLKINILKVFRK